MTLLLGLVYLFFGRIAPWSLPVTLALYMGRKLSLRVALSLMVAIGVMEDIAYVRPLGLTSLVLMTLTAVIWLCERLYRGKLLWWWFGFGVLGEVAIRLMEHQPHLGQAAAGQLLALVVVFWINQRLQEPEGIYVGQ